MTQLGVEGKSDKFSPKTPLPVPLYLQLIIGEKFLNRVEGKGSAKPDNDGSCSVAWLEHTTLEHKMVQLVTNLPAMLLKDWRCAL